MVKQYKSQARHALGREKIEKTAQRKEMSKDKSKLKKPLGERF